MKPAIQTVKRSIQQPVQIGRLTNLKKFMIAVALSHSSILMAESEQAGSAWYIQAGIGQVSGSRSTSSLVNDLEQNGVTVNQLSQDDSRTGWRVALGFDVSDYFAVELGYVDLGDVGIRLTAEVSDAEQFLASAKKLHPNSADGYTLSGVYRYPLSQNFNLSGRVGVFSWDGDFDSVLLDSNQSVGDNNISGSDLYFGFGGEYHLNKRTAVSIEWERYELDNEDSDLFSVNLRYHF